MTDKKTTKTEKQAEAKKPAKLKDGELDQVQGGRRTDSITITTDQITLDGQGQAG